MTSYLSSMTNYVLGRNTENHTALQKNSERKGAPVLSRQIEHTIQNQDQSSVKTAAVAKRGYLALSYWLPNWIWASEEEYTNKTEAQAASVLLTPLPKNFSLITDLYNALIDLAQQIDKGTFTKEMHAKVKNLIQKFHTEDWKKFFGKGSNEEMEEEEMQAVVQALHKLPKKLERISGRKTISSADFFDEEVTLAFTGLERKLRSVKDNLFFALQYLQDIFTIYSKNNLDVLNAEQLITNKIELQQVTFNEKETSLLARAVHELHAQNKADVFLNVLDKHFRVNPLQITKDAERSIWDLRIEIEALTTDKKIADKIGSLYHVEEDIILPENAARYLMLLKESEPFERFHDKTEQIQALLKLGAILSSFVDNKENKTTKHFLIAGLKEALTALENSRLPSKTSLKALKDQAHLSIDEPINEKKSPSAATSLWNKATSAVQTVQAIRQMTGGEKKGQSSSEKEPSAIDKVGTITDKLLLLMNSIKSFIEKELVQAHELLTQTQQQLVSLRMNPSEEQVKSTISFLFKLLEQPSAIIRKEHWDEDDEDQLLRLKKSLELTLQNSPLSLNDTLTLQIQKVEQILQKEITELSGDLPNLMQMFQKFLLDPERGLVAKSFNQLDLGMKKIEDDLIAFLRDNTKEAHPALLAARKSLANLLGNNPHSQDAQLAVKSLRYLIENSEKILRHNEWTLSERENLLSIMNKLEKLANLEPFVLDEDFKNQVAQTLHLTIDKTIEKLDGNITATLQIFKNFIVDPQNGLLAESLNQTEAGFHAIMDQFSNYLANVLQKGHATLINAQSLLWNLRFGQFSEDDVENLIFIIQELLENPEEMIRAKSWKTQDLENLIALQKDLKQLLNKKAPFKINSRLKSLIDKTSDTTIAEAIENTQGQLSQVFSSIQAFLNHPSSGLLSTSIKKINGEVRWLESEFSEFLETEMNHVEGKLSSTLDLFKNFILHPEHGLLSGAFNQLGQEISHFKTVWSEFVEEQTKQADDALYQAKKSLIALRDERSTKEQIKQAHDWILKLYKEPNHFSEKCSEVELAALLHLANGLLSFYQSKNYFIPPILMEEVESMISILSPKVDVQQGALNQASSRLLDNLVDRIAEKTTEPKGLLHQAAEKISKTASPELEEANRLLNKLIHEIENAAKPAVRTLINKTWQSLKTLASKKQSYFSREALELRQTDLIEELAINLSDTSITNKKDLLPILKECKSFLDKEIELQLGDGAKVTRTLVNEVKQGVVDVLDEFESRVRKYTQPVYSALGISQEEDESATFEKVIAAAEIFQQLLQTNPSKNEVEKALKELECLLKSPQTYVQRGWKESEKTELLKLQSALEKSLSSSKDGISDALQKQVRNVLENTLAPFTSTPLNKMIEGLSETLSQLMTLSATKAGSALSKKMGEQVAFGARLLLESVQNQLSTKNKDDQMVLIDQKYRPIADAITRILPLISAAEKHGGFEDLWTVVQSIREQIKQLPPIYVNKVPLFFRSERKHPASSIFSPYADGIAKDKNVLHDTEESPIPKTNFRQLTDLNKQEFAENTSLLVAMKTIFETVCGAAPQRLDFYTRILDKAIEEIHGESSLKASKVKAVFFKHLNELHRTREINLFQKWIAKSSYLIMVPIVNILINRFAERFINYVRNLIAKNNEDGFAQLQDLTVDNFNSFLGALGDAYKSILKQPVVLKENTTEVKGSLPEKVKAEMYKAEYNKGIAPKDLYKEVVKQGVEHFFPTLQLTKIWDDFFEKHKLNENSAIKAHVNSTARFFLNSIRFFIWMSESVINRLFISKVKGLFLKNQILEKILDQNLGSIASNNEYIHAVNCVIADQLQKILDEMNDNYMNKVDAEAPELHKDAHSNHQKKELTRLVTSVLEVLEESKCLTEKQLESLLNDKSYIQKIHDTMDSFFIPDLVDSAVKLIKMSYDSIMNEDQLEAHLSNFFSVVNDSFKTKKVTENEFQAKEEEISILIDRILELTISDTINKKFDFSIEKQKNQINHFMFELRTGITQFEAETRKMMSELAQNINQEQPDLSEKLVEKLMLLSKEFKTGLSKELHTLISQKDFDGHVKEMLYDLSQTNAEYLEELDLSLRQMIKMKGSHNQSAFKTLIGQAGQALDNLKTWSESDDLKPIEPIDFSLSQMTDFKDYITRTAHARVKERIDGLIDFFKDSLTYRFGIFHHLLFIPFVQDKFANIK